ncbi:MFS general substrate transporter [Tothia fuscella]|uniref:MFS general substrate transporter n=1 Tax=Tothia fuscella TaxID=1048955 RepID=A0A9P4NWQ7_9PEZI|nr:MFS general substrate transporter [Tothia fuscella]
MKCRGDFTKDVGLEPDDLNTAVAVFFAFFVALQPVGAVLGRKIGMAVYVPICMSIWGLCTALHVWVKTKWQLVLLRAVIGSLEAGFYPVTVSYLSLFYTRYEFARRLGIFYGQYAIAGALGGLLAYGVFSKFPHQNQGASQPADGWRAWQILFLLEGGCTIVLAMAGFFWLPHNAKTAWFLSPSERAWAEERIKRDMDGPTIQPSSKSDEAIDRHEENDRPHSTSEENQGLLGSSSSRAATLDVTKTVTDDRGLTHADIASAILDWKLWYLLTVNILSSMPVTAFSVFLPLVLRKLTNSPEQANLLTAPPFLVGAVVLYTFTTWSDKRKERIVPILWGLGLLLVGLTGVVALPANWLLTRYTFLCILMGGTFVPSPLTVAWFTGNTPETGKRSVMLGINGWGNLAGVFSAMLFQPSFAPTYRTPFFVTFALVMIAFAGFALFRMLLIHHNRRRQNIVAGWTQEDVETESQHGTGPAPTPKYTSFFRLIRMIGGESATRWAALWLRTEGGRKGDEKLTFQYGL